MPKLQLRMLPVILLIPGAFIGGAVLAQAANGNYEFKFLSSSFPGAPKMERFYDADKQVVCYRVQGNSALSCTKSQ